jgi:putative aldouronate transport system permease protein
MANRESISSRRSKISDVSYDVVRLFALVTFTILCVLPFIHVLGVSLMPQREAMHGTAILWPRTLEFDAYRTIVGTPNLMRSMYNSVYITVVGTVVSMVLTSTLSYGLSKAEMPGARFFNWLLAFTMLFGAGIIPLYIVVRSTGLLNRYWSVILPLAINPFWAILMRNFFEQLPKELMDSAYVDGAGEGTILARIVLPLSKAAIAVFVLFYSVFYWNSFFHALMFITDSQKWPIQVWLREMVRTSATMQTQAQRDMDVRAPVTIRSAVTVFATVPILLVYPFLQKHFAKGVLLGAVKG